jgi:hypothetical protein
MQKIKKETDIVNGFGNSSNNDAVEDALTWIEDNIPTSTAQVEYNGP